MNIKRYAAIDIGSNAIRMLTKMVVESPNKPPQFKKTSLVRVPIRLGTDVFVEGGISKENIDRMQETMRAFRLLMKAEYIDQYKACATSAMREAKNGEMVTALMKENTGIDIEIIDGKQEAAIIANTDLHDFIKTDKTYLYVDVGGGSTEFTIFSNGRQRASKSFKIGTVRLLNNLVRDSLWKQAKSWVNTQTDQLETVKMIGSGGNINYIFKKSGRKKSKPITIDYLSSYYQLLKSLTYEERVTELRMKLDRADVIVPAAEIYLSAMKWSGARKIYVPKIGLADGIIKALYYQEHDQRMIWE